MNSSFPQFDRVIDRSGTGAIKWDHRPTNAAGDPVLPMWVADMDFPVPPPVTAAIARRLEHPVFGYTLASQAWRDAFRAWQRERNGWEIDPKTMVFSPGVMPSVRAAVLTFTEPGDEVVVQPPVYFPFFDAIRDNGRVVVENPLRPVESESESALDGVRYEMDLAHLESVITPRTRAVLLSSPHNPVGRVWAREELAALAQVAQRHDLVVIADEIHSDIVRRDVRFVPFATLGPAAASRAIVCNSPTKTFNIAGLSSSHVIIADAGRRERFQKTLARLGLTLPNILALEAARAAYAEGGAWADALLVYLDDQIEWFAGEVRRRFSADAGRGVRLSPIEGTYLAWLDTRPLMERLGVSHRDVSHALFEEAALRLSDGTQFGAQGAGFFRMNLAAPRATVRDGVDRLERAVAYLERTT